MSTSKHIDKICLAAVAVTLVLTLLFMFGGSLGLTASAKAMKYETTFFDTSYVHRIDLVMDDWEGFLETCENEEYASCTAVVDGKKHANVAIRAKGNTSLSSVKASGSQRYSFKLEFDHYASGKSLDGLDKLCLNNLIQDNTMMKDYLVFRMMGEFGVDSPLCSYVWLTVNGEDWGLYLAVEGVEDSFLARNYGSDAGELYKPDSMSFGGGRGNGKDFNFDDLEFDDGGEDGGETDDRTQGSNGRPDGFPSGGQFPGQPGGDGQQGGFPGGHGGGPGGQGGGPGGQGGFPGGQGGGQSGSFPGGQFPGGEGGPGGGMGSDDVKLKYIDDDPDSYPNIFDNAKTDVTSEDKERLISSLQQLGAYENLEEVLDTDEVLRYFVVHNFVCNGDSYTGSMIHNYYLHEQDGRLGMIPWDYNLAFGTFQGGSASSSVNASIDSPVSGSLDDRPMVGWIFSDESYTERYHELFAEFLSRWFSNGELEKLIADTAEMLRPYVEKDPTKFCTVEEFDAGVAALSQFVSLRGEAVGRQLGGDSTTVETGDLNLSDMGSMGGGRGDVPGSFKDGGAGSSESSVQPVDPNGDGQAAPGQNGTGQELPSGEGSGGWQPPSGGQQPPSGGQQPPGGGQQPSGGGQQFPGGGQQMPGKAAKDSSAAAQSGGTESPWLLLGVSVLVLAAGLIIALKKKY